MGSNQDRLKVREKLNFTFKKANEYIKISYNWKIQFIILMEILKNKNNNKSVHIF